MTKSEAVTNKVIQVLKILLEIENVEIIKCTIESLIEELEDLQNKENSNQGS